MAKTSKKITEDPIILPISEAPAPELVTEAPPSPPIEESEPESAEENEDETTVEAFQSEPEKKADGRRPNKFGQSDVTILDRLNALDTWEGVWAYVYRIQPFSNRLVGGNRKIHVKRYDAPFDVQDLMIEAGSGVYQIQATRLQPTTGKRPMFDTGEIRILNQNHPPKIPPGEWVDDPRNKEWQWAKEAIFKKEPPPAAPPPPDPLVEILREQITAQRAEMASIREAQNKKDPQEQTILGVLLQKLLEKPAPPPPPPPDPVRDMMLAFIMKQLDNRAEPAAPADPMVALEKQIDLQKKLDEITSSRGSGGRSRMSGTEELIAKVTENLAPAVTPLFQMMAAHAMKQVSQQPPAAQQQPGNQQPQPGQQPPQQQIAPQTEPAAVWTAPQTQQQQPPQKPGPQLVKKPTLDQIAAAVLEHLQADKDGYELGDWYLEKFGEDEFTEIRSQGKPQLLADLQTIPNIWRFLAMYLEDGRLNSMLTEFVTWEPPNEHEEPEPPAEEELETDDAADAIKSGWTAPATQEAKV